HKDQLGAGAFLGYQANQYLGFELGYDWLGRMPYWAGPSTTTLVSTVTVTRTVSATAQPTKISWVPARSWATRQTNTWASSWAMTGSAACLT
ncbi:hypothetical protein CQA18_26215, partial [Enterobacter hormaechei]